MSVQVLQAPIELAADKSSWGGMSGGPVIADDRLLGVINEHNLSAGQSTLTAVAVGAVLCAGPLLADWCRWLGIKALEDVLELPARDPSDGTGRQSRPVVVGHPPPLAAAYVDREDVRKDVYAAWIPVALGDTLPRKTCVIVTGDGGVGKTQLAVKIFELAAAHTEVRVWVSATTRQTLLEGYAAAADAVGAPGVAKQDLTEIRAGGFLQWLSSTTRRWLVVLDDFWLKPSEMDPLWPPETPTGRVLVTTREQDAALAAARWTHVLMKGYTPEEANDYLTSRLGEYWQGADLANVLDGSSDLVEELGCLPVALSQAAAYVSDAKITCRTYQVALKSKSATLSRLFPATATPVGYPRTVPMIWSLAIDLADAREPRGLARPASHIAAVIEPACCPRALWTTKAIAQYVSEHGPPTPLLAANVDDVDQALVSLSRLSVVSLSVHTPMVVVVRVHPLAQRAIWETLGDCQRDQVITAAADALVELWPEQEIDPLIPLLQMTSENLRKVDEHDALFSADVHPVLFQAGTSLGRMGRMSKARDYFREIAGKAENRFGKAHRSTLTARRLWAFWMGRAGDPARARDDFGQLVAECKTILGVEDRDTLSARTSLARFQGQSGDPTSAVEGCTRLRADCERLLGLDHSLTLVVRHNLAHWLAKTGEFQRAVTLFEEVLANRQRILGVNDPETLVTRNDLAYNRGSAGDPARAVRELEAVLAARQETLGPHHPETLLTRTDLAKWREVTATNWAGLVVEWQQLYEDDLRVVGPEHSYTLRARIQLANAKGLAGDPVMAIAGLERVFRDCQTMLGPGHPTTANAKERLGQWRERVALAGGAMARDSRGVGSEDSS